jgi:uncharacterized C2H2 Zn-finger protein
MVHTCPRCELRFETDVELIDHLEREHDVTPGSFERNDPKQPKRDH